MVKSTPLSGWQSELQRFLVAWDEDGPPSMAFSTAICAAMGRQQAALQAFNFGQFIRQKGLQMDTFFCNNVLQACSSTNRWDLPLAVLETMLHWGPSPDIASFGATVHALATSGRWRQALAVADHVVLNEVILGALVAACEKAAQWEVALDLLRSMKGASGASVQPNVVIYSSAISACEKGGEWRAALGVLEELGDEMLQADLIAYSASISACARGGHWQQALQLMAEMNSIELLPNIVIYNAALDALAHEPQNWTLAFQLLRSLRSATFRPQLESYSCALRAIGPQRWQQSLALWTEMLADGIQADAIAFGAMLDVEMGSWQISLWLLKQMEEHHMRPDAVAVAAVLRSCEGKQQLQLLEMLQDEAEGRNEAKCVT